MPSTITIDGVSIDVYDGREVVDLVKPHVAEFGTLDGFKALYRLTTHRLFSKAADGSAKVMLAPRGFTWEPGLRHASGTTGTTRRLYFEKAEIDALVLELSAA